MQAKPCIVIPNPYLTGGHQIKNAEILTQSGAAEIITEDKLTSKVLVKTIDNLLGSKEKREALGSALHSLANPDSAKKIAQILIDTINSSK
jgi:UDP-N-acetylglucosamine--N-acetylmuramyl-(pentapeptide) pyrophosphoryl-undecaprenol N-acetylglucosamine transferase